MGILILLVIVAVLGAIDAKAKARRIKEAYAFDPPNSHGGARFADNKDLKKAGLFKARVSLSAIRPTVATRCTIRASDC